MVPLASAPRWRVVGLMREHGEMRARSVLPHSGEIVNVHQAACNGTGAGFEARSSLVL